MGRSGAEGELGHLAVSTDSVCFMGFWVGFCNLYSPNVAFAGLRAHRGGINGTLLFCVFKRGERTQDGLSIVRNA